MTTEQRIERVEDELEQVKRILLRTAGYAESANAGLERLTVRVDRIADSVDSLTAAQNRTQVQLDRLTDRVDSLTAAQDRTQVQLDRLTDKVDSLTAAQDRTQVQLDQLAERVDRMGTRIDEFVFQVQRLLTHQGERLVIVEGQNERLVGVVQMLARNYEAQQSQLQEFQLTTNAALERIDRILDYLLKERNG